MVNENKNDLTELITNGDMGILTERLTEFPYLCRVQNEYGDFIAHIAAQAGRSDVILLLTRLEYDFNYNYNSAGYLPIHTACHFQQLDCVIALKLGGADLNARTESDLLTPLHIACKVGCIPLVRLLLRENVKWDLEDIYGCTPAQAAILHGHTETAEAILHHTQFPRTNLSCSSNKSTERI